MSLKRNEVSKHNRLRLYFGLRCVLVAIVLGIGATQTLAQCEDGETLVEQQKLTASDAGKRDWYGDSISISGNTVIVGASLANCTAGSGCGAAYIYRFNGVGWIEEQKLTASNASFSDLFGTSVSVSSNVAVVGAEQGDCRIFDIDCGASYVYRFNGTNWIEEQELKATDDEESGGFGHSVAVSEDKIVIGRPYDDCIRGTGCGSVYVYRYNGTSWAEQQRLIALDAGNRNFFGQSVTVSNDIIVVGATGDNCIGSSSNVCGSAYVFRFNGTYWIQEQKLTASDAESEDLFGVSVSVSGDMAFVGAQRDDCTLGIDCGSAYIYQFNGTSWDEKQKLTASDKEVHDNFGNSVSLSGNIAIVGTRMSDYKTCIDCGSAYVYRFNGFNWVEIQKLIASDAEQNDWFGSAVSVSGDTVVVGSRFDDCKVGEDCGSAYVFSCASSITTVNLDIKPGSCPNPVNPRSRGVVPVAIVGSLDFDVTKIDLDSLTLSRNDGVGGSVSPISGKRSYRNFIEDVTTPSDGELCECHELDGDGIDDLSLKFSTSEMSRILELNDIPRGEKIELALRGNLLDGSPIEAVDCITIPGTNQELRELNYSVRPD